MKGIRRRSYGNFACVIIKGQMVGAELLCSKRVFNVGDIVQYIRLINVPGLLIDSLHINTQVLKSTCAHTNMGNSGPPNFHVTCKSNRCWGT